MEIVKQLGWNYITAVYTDDEYGKEEEKEFRRLANQQGICVTNSKVLPSYISYTTTYTLIDLWG